MLGVSAAAVCIEKPAETEQNGAWCRYRDGDSDGGSPQRWYATLDHRPSGVAPVDPVRTRPRPYRLR